MKHLFDERFKYGGVTVFRMKSKAVEINKYVIADPEICHGKPTFRGTRVMVSLVLEMLEGGAGYDEILAAYPSLTQGHIRAALDFAARVAEQSFDTSKAKALATA